ncbi:hypothetical protein Lal_00030313 [Lupinus albus]|nr:hypothetical protein Lal_00030313 [Lupinus albus]
MDVKKKEQEQYTSITFFSPNPNTLYSMFSAMEFYTNMKNINARADKSYYNSFAPCEASCGYFDDPFEKHAFQKSETDSCSGDDECGDECDDEEVSLDELIHEGKTKNKIEKLAAMVGVDTTEAEIVLAEVVRVLKHLKRINQFYLSD